MKKITLKYLKDNLNLKNLIKELDKKTYEWSDDNIYIAVMDSFEDLIDDDGMEIGLHEHLLNIGDEGDNFLNKIRDLSFNGKLLQTLSKNFKFLREVLVEVDYEKCYFECIFSKINKTYYLLLNHPRGLNSFIGVLYKSKKEKGLMKKLGELRGKIIDTKNISSIYVK